MYWSARPIDDRRSNKVKLAANKLSVEPAFCYLSEMLSAVGGCDSEIAARFCSAWGRFLKLLQILTTRQISFRKHLDYNVLFLCTFNKEARK